MKIRHALTAATAAILLVLTGCLNATAATESHVFTDTVKPTNVTDSDTSPVELGVKFIANKDINITGIRFYQGPKNTGTHVGRLWSGSRAVASLTFPTTTTTGWQEARFSAPVKVTKGSTYIASYTAPKGRYSGDANGFSKAVTDGTVTFPVGAGLYNYTVGKVPNQSYKNTNYYVDVLYTSVPVVTDPPTTQPPTPTPTPTTEPTNPPTTGFPDASTTGVPDGVTLTPYTGSLTITTPNTVIDSKTINGQINIKTTGVVIKNSLITGTIYNDSDNPGSFTVTDSNINVGNNPGTGIGDVNFVATRVEVTGGNRSVNCFSNCTLQASYVHGQFRDTSGVYHESGVRMGSDSQILGNNILCDAPDFPPDAGCSADLTGYGDFAIVQRNTIDGNYFGNTTGGYCTYGGSTRGKPYSNGVNNIKFTNNVWEKNSRGTCGAYGPITSFDDAAPGNVWSNNKWNDGSVVNPSN